jgi:hypothetical protein
MDDTPPPIDERTPAHGLPLGEATAPLEPERTQRLAGPPERTRRLAVPAAVGAPPSGAATAEARPSAAVAPEARAVAAPPEPKPPESKPPPATTSERAAPERVPGPPLVLGGGDVHPAERPPPPNGARRAAPPRPAEPLTDLDRDVAAAARQVPELDGTDDLELVDEVVDGDDLALATEVAAAVETETDDDAEWAQLARGPQAFPDGKPRTPPDGDAGPEEPRD